MIVAQVSEDLVRRNRVQIRQGVSCGIATRHEIVELVAAEQSLSGAAIEVLDTVMSGQNLFMEGVKTEENMISGGGS